MTPFFDIHTHIDYHSPVAKNAWDVLNYHYFKEMAHTQGLAKKVLNGNLDPKNKTEKIAKYLEGIKNTNAYYWLIALIQKFFGFEDNYFNQKNWEEIYNVIENKTSDNYWKVKVRQLSNIEHIGLTNCIWESLDGLEDIFMPNLRIDDLMNIENKECLKKIKAYSRIEIRNLTQFEQYISDRFDYFIEHKATAASISLQPGFSPMKVDKESANNSFAALVKTKRVELDKIKTIKAYILNYVVEKCRQYNIPFQIMFGVKRKVYKHGVLGGEDLSDPTSSLGSLAYIFNTYPDVNFLVSVLNQTQSQELCEYARIFPNVYVSGHWWYGSTEKKIEQALIERLELVPYKKHIGQYSDSYILEFIWPKVDLYRRIESNVFAELYTKGGKLAIDECIEIIRNRDYIIPKTLMNK